MRIISTKVPDATPSFWAAKLATTAFGEAFSDFVFFNDAIGQHLAMLLGLALFVLCAAWQLSRRAYAPVSYWLTVVAVSIFGTMSADFLNQDLGMPLWASTLLLLVLQTGVFIAWRRVQGSLDVHAVTSRTRETFYWLTVLFTFALGTAAGDFVSTTLGLGTFAATFVFLAAIAVPFVGWRWFRLNGVVAFWLAYTFTRPLGASFADWLGVPAPYGDGLQLGTSTTSLVFGVILVAVVGTLVVRHHAAPRRTGGSLPARTVPPVR
jgi:uncharacterized membrane-anchored protein